MNWKRELAQNGYVKATRVVGISRKRKSSKEKEEKEIEICLNCTEQNCKGICDKIRRLK